MWQPIETCPQDKRFLAYVPIKNHRQVIALKTKDGLILNEALEPMYFPPSHWMPLPAPPDDQRE